MSIEAKQLMLKKLEKEFNNTLSATTTDNILKTIADQLDLYSLEPIGESDLDIISNDMLNSFLTAKQLEGRSEKTLERYKYIISKLLVIYSHYLLAKTKKDCNLAEYDVCWLNQVRELRQKMFIHIDFVVHWQLILFIAVCQFNRLQKFQDMKNQIQQ